MLALVAALAFGVTAPLVQRFASNAGPFAVSALLYFGAACVAAFTQARRGREAKLRLRHVPILVGMALAGAVAAPALLAWGLARTSGVSAGLGLNFEAVFTALFGYLLLRETIGRRALAALVLMTAGGALLVVGRAREGASELFGLAAIMGGTAGWGLDNALSNRLAEVDPGQVVVTKASLGTAVSLVLMALTGQDWPSTSAAFGLFAVGATGYGLSLRLYLMAQRRVGAARTASLFATAPFIAAAVAAFAGEPWGGVPTAAASVLMVFGLALHLTEDHRHFHRHERLVHDHAHRHAAPFALSGEDPHHTHRHDPPFVGEHAHPHEHEPTEHEHPHMPDAHHLHPH